MIQLFNIDRVLTYKAKSKRSRETRVAAFETYQNKLHWLTEPERGLQMSIALDELLNRDAGALRGRALNEHEDTLDAVFCAYLAWYCWRWGKEKNEMFGTLEEGYLVVPKGHVTAPAAR